MRTFKVVDLFCGAGGSSTGARRAIAKVGGEMDLVAVNHWNIAIATHFANHPTARHVVEDVSMVDPESVVEDGYLDLLMASPECTYHSRARGGKPIHDQGRMNPWVVMNWLTKLDVQHVLIENVPEFVDWGRLGPDDRPDKAHKGEHFQAWFLTFGNLGYSAEWRMLNAADYGDATTRTRFFLLARKDGGPITWPEPSHGKTDSPMFPGRLPWRGAREIIDWSNQGRSLLDDPKYLRKPLSEKTRRRIARGLERFGGPLAPLYIRLLDLPEHKVAGQQKSVDPGFLLNRHGDNGSARIHSVDEPMPTATTRGAGYLVQPQAEPFMQANRNHNAPKGIDEPIPVITSAGGGGSFVVEPDLQPFLLGQQSGAAPRDTDEPVPTIATDGAISLTRPTLIEYYGDIRDRDVNDPVSTITQRIKHALIQPMVLYYQGASVGRDVDSPLSTITANRKHHLANPVLVEYYGSSLTAVDVERPLPTVTTKDRHGLAQPSIVRFNGTGIAHDIERPLSTITAAGKKHGLVQPILVDVNHGEGSKGDKGDDGRAHSVDGPLGALTTKRGVGLAVSAAEPYIIPNFGEAVGQEPRVHAVDDPTPTVTSKGAGSLVQPTLEELESAGVDSQRIVFLNGHPFLLDIRFRMLQNTELARAMGFQDGELAYEFVGTVADVTKQIGNAVPVGMATALVAAALRE